MNQAELAAAADDLRRQGNLPAALVLCERLHNDDPGNPLILATLVDVLVASRQAGRALILLATPTGNTCSHSDANSALLSTAKAKALLALDRWPEALELFRSIVDQFPTWADGWNNLGCCLLARGRDAEASVRLHRAVELNPLHLEATQGLASLYKRLGHLQKSRTLLEKLLSQVDHLEARRALVSILLRLEETTAALPHAQQLVQQENLLEDKMQLARVHFLAGDIDAYIDCLDASPNQIWKGVSTASLAIGTLAESGRIEQARQRLATQLERDPADANAQLVQSRDLLSQGNFSLGWRAYAHRLRLSSNQLHFNLEPNWTGQPLKNKSILVLGEQGIGDVCYFSRFLEPLLADNPGCALIAEPRLLPLLHSSYPDLYVLSDLDEISLLPMPLVKIPLGSLPLLYGNSREQVETLCHPLRAREADLICIKSRLVRDALHPTRLGISLFAGRPGDEYQHRKRSLPIRTVLEQFAGMPITLVDLQHRGHPPDFQQEAERLGLQVLQYPDLTDNIGLLAAMITSVNGVLTAQQTNAHLCGALEQKGLVVLPPGCHFVFGEQAHPSWYPSLDVIRADSFGCWDVIAQELPIWLQALLV